MNMNFLKTMEEIQASFYRDDIISAHYVILTSSAHNVMFAMTGKKSPTPLEFQEDARQWDIGYKALDAQGWSIRDLIVEKDFIDAHNRFELLLSEILYAIFDNFPRFLRKYNPKPDISYDDLNNSVDLSDIMRATIEKKVSSVIREKTTDNQIEYILDICGLTKIIAIPDRDKIILFSTIRNCVMHGNRKFTKHASASLKKAKIAHSFQIDENLLGYIGKNSIHIRSTYGDAGQALLKGLMDNVLQIEKRHDSFHDDFA